jgi:hypothetical protein
MRLPPETGETLGAGASAFGIAAIVTILFSTVLTIAQDISDTVHHLLEKLAGHQWTALGLLDLALFLSLGCILWRGGRQRGGTGLANALGIAATASGGVLALWFLLV